MFGREGFVRALIVAFFIAKALDQFTNPKHPQQNGLTTYSVGCATDPCAGWANLPEFTYTVAIGPNTFDMKYTDEPVLSTHTACTFTGSPATAASCEMTNAGTIAHSTLGYEYHFTVPGWTGSGNWDLWNVQSATLRVVDGTVAASGSATSGAVSGSGSRSGSAMVTPAPTTGTGVSGSGLAQASSTASTGAVVRTGVPGWLVGVGMGVAAGAVLGV